jgi:hypothetical protein
MRSTNPEDVNAKEAPSKEAPSIAQVNPSGRSRDSVVLIR